MKFWIGMTILLVAFVGMSLYLTTEGALALYFGWILYPFRVLPQVQLNLPYLVLGVVALVLFALGIHLAGRRLARQVFPHVNEKSTPWRVGWTLSFVIGVVVLFAAGTSVVGMVHQASWLATSESPLFVESVSNWRTTNSSNNLRQIALAMGNYESASNRLPPGGTFSPDGRSLHSWETHVLPYIPYATSGIDMQKSWNDPANQRIFRRVLPEFINPELRGAPFNDNLGYGLSHYSANSWVLSGNRSMKLSEITDGAANTLLIGEVNNHFKPWGHPVNWRDPTLGINRSPDGFGGVPGSGQTNFVMADGSVRVVKDSISPEVLRALSTPRGGEKVSE